MEQPRHSSDFQETDPGLAHPVPFEAPERHPRFADRLQATFRLGFRHPATFAARLALRKDVLPAWFFSVVVALPFHALAFLLGRATFRLISGPAHSRLTHALLAQIPVLLCPPDRSRLLRSRAVKNNLPFFCYSGQPGFKVL